MSFDNLCKLLSEKYPSHFASWVLNRPQTDVEVLNTELSIEPIRADSVTFLQLQGRILHLEFQTQLRSKPPLPLRMLDYWVRLSRCDEKTPDIKDLVKRLFREGMMRESVIYQEIIQEGRQEGRQGGNGKISLHFPFLFSMSIKHT